MLLGRNRDVGLSTKVANPSRPRGTATAGGKPSGVGFSLIYSIKNIAVKERGEQGKGPLTHRIHTRLSRQKYEELSELLFRSRGVRSLSELLRNIINERPVMIRTYDGSLDAVLEEMAAIRKEILAIGRNISKVTAMLHREQLPAASISAVLELGILQQQTDLKVTRLFVLTAKLSERWLPK